MKPIRGFVTEPMILTNSQLKSCKRFWNQAREITELYYEAITNLEEKMAEETLIDDIEFFWVDGEIVGVGNESQTLKLVHDTQLDEAE